MSGAPLRSGVLLLGVATLLGCLARPPACPYQGAALYAPSAGCLALRDRELLVLRDWSGRVSPPGGSSAPGESAQCTAHRETWEETGLDLVPGELVSTFDTGFFLFRCDARRPGGELRAPGAEGRPQWLPLERLRDEQWRYPGQGELLLDLLDVGAAKARPRQFAAPGMPGAN